MYLSSKHESTGDLSRMRYPNRLLSKSLPFCTCNYPFYNAPYCQGNVTVFGENSGQQCVALSLCALIYGRITKITSVDDMTQIMIVGIQLYPSLSLLADNLCQC